MKRIYLPLAIWLGSSLVSIAFIGTFVPAAVAGRGGVQKVINSLAQPNSFERFFERGRERLEREIQYLQRVPGVSDRELLTIDPAVLDGPKHPRELERESSDRVPAPIEAEFTR